MKSVLVAIGAVFVISVAACDDKKSTTGSRVDGAKTVKPRGKTTKAFCDVHAEAGKGAIFDWPGFAGGATPPTSTGETWRWVNVWATWCPPCIEEMPRIAKWRDKLATPARPLEVTFISADESDADVAEFRTTNPAIPESRRLDKPDKLNDWLSKLGLTGEPPIPIHVFVDPKNQIRCVRAAAIHDSDFAAVEKLLGE